jgi:WD40 repeat protein
MQSPKSTLVLRVYDVPSFQESDSFDTQIVMDATHSVQDMLFLPGDEVLAMCCAYGSNNDMVRFLDLRTGEVTSEMTLPGGAYDMSWDGDNIVVASDQGGIWTISPPYNEFNRTQVGPDYYTKDVSVNGSSGWCHLGWQYNIKVMAGMPREKVAGFETKPNRLECVSWTGVPGDFMIGSLRPNRGSSLQLWRLGDGEEGDWRSVGGARLLTELNSTRKVDQIEADPAFPGIMAVSYDDGTLALYHLNLTPYPSAPEELGGLDINPYIPPPDNGDGGDANGNGLLWGSERDWVFPVVLASLIAVLVGVLVLLRVRTGNEDE